MSKESVRLCAVYTRKSSEEGLEQEFNSLDAQREAGIAYIRSQAGEGWRLVDARYDDGGISGGTLERPALKRLLEDIKLGRVHTVVVYKVDRLTRSLGDFAKLVEVFEKHGVSFVSVTQQFNTTTSMGRLMLNVLLSFAQFEREVTGERIRDKIAASKKKGMWMGGTPPIGYEVKDRKLVVVEKDAKLVRHIFRRYAELGSITLLARELVRDGSMTRRYTSAAGREFGDRPFSRGHLHRILSSRIYLGEVVHGDTSYPGEHSAIVDETLWAPAAARIEENRHGRRRSRGEGVIGLLRAKVFDDAGNPMTPVRARKGVRRYRYYVSRAALQGRGAPSGSVSRVGAGLLECAVMSAAREAVQLGRIRSQWHPALARASEAEAQELLLATVRRVVVCKGRVEITIVKGTVPEGNLPPTSAPFDMADADVVRVPLKTDRQHGGVVVIPVSNEDATHPMPNSALVSAIVRGNEWARMLLSGEVRTVSEIAREAKVTGPYVSRLIRYAFLAPDLADAGLSGKEATRGGLDVLLDSPLLSWAEQRSRLASQSVRR